MLRSGPPDKIIDMVGEGTFGKVLSCWDRTARRMVAIKVVRDIKKYQEAAEIEIDVLKRLARHDPTNTRCIHTHARSPSADRFNSFLCHLRSTSRCIKLERSFMIGGHTCLVFPLLGKSLYEFLKSNRFSPFPIHQIRALAYQLLYSIACTYQRLLLVYR